MARLREAGLLFLPMRQEWHVEFPDPGNKHRQQQSTGALNTLIACLQKSNRKCNGAFLHKKSQAHSQRLQRPPSEDRQRAKLRMMSREEGKIE